MINGFHIHMQHINMIGFGLICLAILIFHIVKWKFIEACLSDKGEPSSTRLYAYVFVLTVAINEIYTTLHTMDFKDIHLLYLLVAIGVLTGLIKSTELTSILKGGGSSQTIATPDSIVKTETDKPA